MTEKDEPKLFLELGQVIQIQAPTDPTLHENIYMIHYLDNNLIKLINNNDLSEKILRITNGEFTNKSISKINILATQEEKGYARQNGLIPGTYITIEFGGDVPAIFNGQITDLEEDMIELTQYETDKKIYIDFEGKGIPLELPIIDIRSFSPPEKKSISPDDDQDRQLIDDDNEEEIIDEDQEDLELIIDTEELKENVRNIYINLDELTLEDEDLGEIEEMEIVNESQRRFGINKQSDDLLDELLSDIPSDKRTSRILNNIHISIERFKQLRRKFSNFDESGNAESIKVKGANYKPLIEKMHKLNKQILWLLPIVRNKHKIFNFADGDNDMSDIQDREIELVLNEQNEIIEEYINNNIPDERNKYKYLLQNLDKYYKPFLETDNNTNIITQQEVLNNIEVVIDNLGNFYTNMIRGIPIRGKNEPAYSLQNQRFVIDRYNLGLKKLSNKDPKNKNSKNYLEQVTSNDTVSIVGLMSLTNPFIQYSRINLPKTSIYMKANLHRYNFLYHNILLKNLELERKIIREEDLKNKDFKIEFNTDTFNIFNFKEASLLIDRDNDEIYKNFLEKVIPQTRILFETIKKYIKNGTSYIKIVEHLEPFLVYDDDITFKQYETIIEFMEEQINKHKLKLFQKINEFKSYSNTIDTWFIPNLYESMLKRKGNKGLVFDSNKYNINDNVDSFDAYHNMMKFDCFRLFNTALSINQLSLVQPIDIEEKINEIMEKEEDENNEDGKKDPCATFTLAKKYIDYDDLEADNVSQIFFDKKYDTTPYDIGEAWLKENIVAADDNSSAVRFLSEFLQENNGIKKEQADIDAEAMVYGVKRVRDGDYAILEAEDGAVKYYQRQGDKWRLDRDLSGKNVDEVNFCNYKPSCIKVKQECKSVDIAKDTIENNLLQEITSRFSEELNENIRELKSRLEKEFTYRVENISNIKLLITKKLLKKDTEMVRIASTLEAADERIKSPYEELRDLILVETDLVIKYNNISKFVQLYCREQVNDESPNWFYCNETNVPLLPTFYNVLSEGFRLNKYQDVLNLVKKERGKLSDDGDKIIDKHSGYVIDNIEFDTEEGYDKVSGFKIKTREVMEVTTSDKLKNIRDIKFEAKTEQARAIEKNVKALSKKLSINMDEQIYFVNKIMNDLLDNKSIIKSKAKYNEKFKKMKAQGKKVKPYEKYYDEKYIQIFLGSFSVTLQTAIPDISSPKTYQNCIRSYDGYPLSQDNNMSYLIYLICVTRFLSKDSQRPWKYLKLGNSKNRKEKTNDYAIKLKDFMDNKVLTLSYVKDRLKAKIAFNNTNKKTQIVSREFDVQKWSTFLPPLHNITVSKVQNIGVEFERLLKQSIINDDARTQFGYLAALNGRINSFSFAIIESVQRAINKEPLILETMDGIPFLENACCNEGDMNTNTYFEEKESSIKKHNNTLYDLENLYNKYKNLHKPVKYSIKENTKIVFPKISKQFSETTIYLAFIKYCKFNSGIVLNEELQGICLDNNSKFKSVDTLERKIEKMKLENLNYDSNSLNNLLNYVNRENILDYNINPKILTEKLRLEHVIERLDKPNLFLCGENIVSNFKKILDRYDIMIEGKDDIITEEFTNYIKALNKRLADNLKEKIEETGNIKPRSLLDFMFLYTSSGDEDKSSKKRKSQFILNWDLMGDNIYMSKKDNTGFYTFRFLKQMVIDICKIFPTIILNPKMNEKIDKRAVPKHWKLKSSRIKNQIRKLMKEEYLDFKPFYSNNVISPVLEYVYENSDDLIDLMNVIPFYANIDDEHGSIFDGEIVKHLGYYFLLCAIKLYVRATEENLTIKETKEIDELDDDDSELATIMGQQENMLKKVCDLLNVYMKNIRKYKKILSRTKEHITKEVLKSKEKEKAGITKRLGDLTVEQREVENIHKNQSLGVWSVGKTRAIYEYDDDQFDKEFIAREKQEALEKVAGQDASDQLSILEEQGIQSRIDAELNDLSIIPEEDDDNRDNIDYM